MCRFHQGIAPTLILVRVGLGITTEKAINESMNLSTDVKFSKSNFSTVGTLESRAQSNDISVLSDETDTTRIATYDPEKVNAIV